MLAPVIFGTKHDREKLMFVTEKADQWDGDEI